MPKPWRLTRQAERSLVEIARWTFQTFGPRQTEDLRFTRAGQHFIVFADMPDQVIIVDVLHSRSDLPRRLAALGDPKDTAKG